MNIEQAIAELNGIMAGLTKQIEAINLAKKSLETTFEPEITELESLRKEVPELRESKRQLEVENANLKMARMVPKEGILPNEEPLP